MAERAAPFGVSIVTVALNAARQLPLTLESAIGQDYPDLEIIVVDGMSWDDSAAVLRRYAGVVDTIVSRPDAGTYYAMNHALDHVTKDYVIFMNAGDDFFAADAISRAVAALHGPADLFYGNHVYVDGRAEYFRRARPFDEIGGRLAAGEIDDRWHESIPCHQATFTHAGLLRRLRYDTRLRIGADHDLMFRAYEQGARMHYVDEVIAHYHGGGISATQADRCRAENASIYRRFTARPEAVDQLLYQGRSPFTPYNEHTGVALAGLLPPERLPELARPVAGEWVRDTGCTLLSPVAASTALAISGFNAFEGQQAEIRYGDRRIGHSEIPVGAFDVEIVFDRALDPASPVMLVPSRASASHSADDVKVAFILRQFRFRAPGKAQAALDPGTTVAISEDAGLSHLFGIGWSNPEPAHIWSIGPRSDLWLMTGRDAAAVRLRLSGNPHIAEGQELTLLVNGDEASRTRLPSSPDSTLDVDVRSAAWRAGQLNRITFAPSRTASCAADSRDMGVCLKQIEVV